MWVNMVFMTYMAITTTGQEDDGTYNYLVESTGSGKYSISISTKDPLPYGKRESFIARFRGECSNVFTIDDNWVTSKAYICNADSLQTKKGVFKSAWGRDEKW